MKRYAPLLLLLCQVSALAQEESLIQKRVHVGAGPTAEYLFGYGIQGEIWLNRLLVGIRYTRQRESLKRFPRLLQVGPQERAEGISEWAILTGTGQLFPNFGYLSFGLGLGAGFPTGKQADPPFIGMAIECRANIAESLTASFYGNWNARTPYYGLMIGLTFFFDP